MSIKKAVRKINIDVIVGAHCDKCDKELQVDWESSPASDIIDGKVLSFTGGYYSKYDMKTIECVLCEDCIFDILMPYGVIKTWYED